MSKLFEGIYCDMTENPKEIIIAKEDAVFWMDKNGRWHNEHGPFQNKKIIDYFHSCIRRDKQGFYLTQDRDGITEKVYFQFEATALFVFDIRKEDAGLILILNTGKEMVLNPEWLLLHDDVLAVFHDDTLIKFTDRTMMKVSDFIEEKDGHYFFIWADREWPVREL